MKKVASSLDFKWPELGQPVQARILQGSMAQGTLAHAYLIYGPAGIGKSDFVEAFASSIVCTDAAIRPCGSCDACVQWERRQYPDLYRVDADGESIGVDAIRNLKRSLHLRSITGGPGVAIITGAEHMTLVAANALLKILEEPPRNVVIILIANSIHTIPMTIMSRCQLLRLRPVSNAVVDTILSASGIDEAIRRSIIASAHGRLRFALERSKDGGELYLSTVERAIGLMESPLLSRLVQASAIAHESFSERAADGEQRMTDSEAPSTVHSLESILRDMLLLRSGAIGITNSEHRERLRRLSSRYQLSDLYRVMERIVELRGRLEGYANSQLAWEHFYINTY